MDSLQGCKTPRSIPRLRFRVLWSQHAVIQGFAALFYSFLESGAVWRSRIFCPRKKSGPQRTPRMLSRFRPSPINFHVNLFHQFITNHAFISCSCDSSSSCFHGVSRAWHRANVRRLSGAWFACTPSGISHQLCAKQRGIGAGHYSFHEPSYLVCCNRPNSLFIPRRAPPAACRHHPTVGSRCCRKISNFLFRQYFIRLCFFFNCSIIYYRRSVL